LEEAMETVFATSPVNAQPNNARSRNRVLALDAIRGLAVVGMILVVSPGSWNYRLAALDHAAWHGYTLADLVFPAFLFAVGAAMAFRFPVSQPLYQEAVSVARRAVLLIALGLALNLLPNFDFAHLRIPGVLQRIGLCYALAAIIMLGFAKVEDGTRHFSAAGVAAAIAFLLVGWIFVLSFTSAPGFPMGSVTEAGTLAAWVDRQVFTVAHLWPYGTDADGEVVYDPEGLLSTFPATVNVLVGALTAHWLGREPSGRKLQYGLAVGVLLIALAHLLDPIFVINKRIWTSTFAIASSGWAILAYCALFYALRAKTLQKLAQPAFILGGNATLAFVISQAFSAVAGLQIGGTTPQNFGFEVLQAVAGEPWTASLLCAFGVLSAVTLLIWPLHRRGIHWRL
jgi:predicted acyltransferase